MVRGSCYWDRKIECCSILITFRKEANVTAKLLNDHFANTEAEAETIFIQTLCVGQLTEVVKEFADILLLYTAPCVNDLCQEETVVGGAGFF
jgi:hypothetical protein